MEELQQSASRNYGLAQSVLLGAFAVVYFLDAGPRVLPHGVADTVGAVLCAGGLLLMLLAFISLGRAIQVAPEPKPGAALVTRGIYRWLRHPIYTGILVVVLGLVLRRPTPLVGVAAVVTLVFLAIKVRFEEQLLLARYPDYAEYRRRSWGLFPGLRG